MYSFRRNSEKSGRRATLDLAGGDLGAEKSLSPQSIRVTLQIVRISHSNIIQHQRFEKGGGHRGVRFQRRRGQVASHPILGRPGTMPVRGLCQHYESMCRKAGDVGKITSGNGKGVSFVGGGSRDVQRKVTPDLVPSADMMVDKESVFEVVCEECEKTVGILRCKQCAMVYCAGCSKYQNSKVAHIYTRRTHTHMCTHAHIDTHMHKHTNMHTHNMGMHMHTQISRAHEDDIA
jgi:hypothetical protein